MRLSTRELVCKDKSTSSDVKKKVEKTNPHWSSFWQIASSDTSLTEGHSKNRKTKKKQALFDAHSVAVYVGLYMNN